MTPDLLIVGAGPAGVSAALWARARELEVLVLDGAPAPGGQLHAVHFHPQDLPGFETGDGPALAAIHARQLVAAGVPVRMNACVSVLEGGPGTPGHRSVRLADGERIGAPAVLIASGVRRRRLGVPGERELEGAGVSYSATRDRERLAGRRIIVVGSGDAAFENALLLAREDCDVTLLVRGEPQARAGFRARVRDEPRIRLRTGVRVTAVLGEAAVRGVHAVGPAGEEELPADGVVVKVGVKSNSEWCADAVALDAEGFVRVDAQLATSSPRVWAAGDITRPLPPSISAALGQGARAAATIAAALRES